MIVIILLILVASLVVTLPFSAQILLIDWLNLDANISNLNKGVINLSYPDGIDQLNHWLNLTTPLTDGQLFILGTVIASLVSYLFHREEKFFRNDWFLLVIIILTTQIIFVVSTLLIASTTVSFRTLEDLETFRLALAQRYPQLEGNVSPLSLFIHIKEQRDMIMQNVLLQSVAMLASVDVVASFLGSISYKINAWINQRLRNKLIEVIDRKIANSLGPLRSSPQSQQINIDPRGNVCLYKIDYQYEWLLGIWPRIKWRVVYDRSKLSNLKTLTKALFANEISDSLDDIRQQIKIDYQDKLKELSSQVLSSISHNIGQLLIGGLNAVLNATISRPNSEFTRAQMALQETSDQTLSRLKQEIVVGIRELINGKVRDFKRDVFAQMEQELLHFNRSQGLNAGAPPLPEGTKFIVSQGEHTLIVIEQKPTIRTLQFNERFIAEERKRLRRKFKDSKRTRRTIALPYVVFVIHFRNNNEPESVAAYFRNSPLTTVNDPLGRAHLPNNGGRICMSLHDIEGGKSIAEVVQAVIFRFFNSEFSTDLSDGYLELAEKELRLSTIFDWEENSYQDPDFVLQINWEAAETTIWDKIRQDGLASNGAIVRFKEINDGASGQLFDRIGQIVEGFCQQLKTERAYASTVCSSLASNLKNLIAEIYHQALAEIELKLDNTALLEQIIAQAAAEVIAERFEQIGNEAITSQSQKLPDGGFSSLRSRIESSRGGR